MTNSTIINSATHEQAAHEQAARALGAAWALEVRRGLRSEKRVPAGGWPGTKREAHARAHWLVTTTSEHAERFFNTTLVTDLAKTVYASAKSAWLANAEDDDDDSFLEQQTHQR